MKARTLARLLEQANNWADGEDSVRNEAEIQITRSEGDYDYHTGDRGFDRRRKCLRRNFYDDRGPDMVAAGFPDDRDAGIVTPTEHSEETTLQTRPKLRNETGGRGSRATTLEHTARPKNNLTDRARYTDSETNEESLDQATPSGIAEASTSWLRKKVDPRQQRPSHSRA